ncbi:MAG: sulfotransferase [Alphaproteobacteria bacterium]|nr:sulfotransferase [Alphaproteobacteria bacterium]
MEPSSSPFVIGGTGGSGTRVVHAVLGQCGVFMGRNLNEAGDAMDFEPFLDEAINPLLSRTRSLNYNLADLGPGPWDEAVEKIQAIIRRYRAEAPRGAKGWGWKNPRSMYVLPLIHQVFPDFRFIHLVRDGKDMAFSGNQNQPIKHFTAYFDESYDHFSPAHAIRLWARANGDVADWGEKTLKERYLRLRFEDLCLKPTDTIQQLIAWAELAGDAENLTSLVDIPSSLGRWKNEDSQVVASLHEAAQPALARFGYSAFGT